jgi:hypothetical protein
MSASENVISGPRIDDALVAAMDNVLGRNGVTLAAWVTGEITADKTEFDPNSSKFVGRLLSRLKSLEVLADRYGKEDPRCSQIGEAMLLVAVEIAPKSHQAAHRVRIAQDIVMALRVLTGQNRAERWRDAKLLKIVWDGWVSGHQLLSEDKLPPGDAFDFSEVCDALINDFGKRSPQIEASRERVEKLVDRKYRKLRDLTRSLVDLTRSLDQNTPMSLTLAGNLRDVTTLYWETKSESRLRAWMLLGDLFLHLTELVDPDTDEGEEHIAPLRREIDELAFLLQAAYRAPSEWTGEGSQAIDRAIVAGRCAERFFRYERALEVYNTALKVINPSDGFERQRTKLNQGIMRCHGWLAQEPGRDQSFHVREMEDAFVRTTQIWEPNVDPRLSSCFGPLQAASHGWMAKRYLGLGLAEKSLQQCNLFLASSAVKSRMHEVRRFVPSVCVTRARALGRLERWPQAYEAARGVYEQHGARGGSLAEICLSATRCGRMEDAVAALANHNPPSEDDRSLPAVLRKEIGRLIGNSASHSFLADALATTRPWLPWALSAIEWGENTTFDEAVFPAALQRIESLTSAPQVPWRDVSAMITLLERVVAKAYFRERALFASKLSLAVTVLVSGSNEFAARNLARFCVSSVRSVRAGMLARYVTRAEELVRDGAPLAPLQGLHRNGEDRLLPGGWHDRDDELLAGRIPSFIELQHLPLAERYSSTVSISYANVSRGPGVVVGEREWARVCAAIDCALHDRNGALAALFEISQKSEVTVSVKGGGRIQLRVICRVSESNGNVWTQRVASAMKAALAEGIEWAPEPSGLGGDGMFRSIFCLGFPVGTRIPSALADAWERFFGSLDQAMVSFSKVTPSKEIYAGLVAVGAMNEATAEFWTAVMVHRYDRQAGRIRRWLLSPNDDPGHPRRWLHGIKDAPPSTWDREQARDVEKKTRQAVTAINILRDRDASREIFAWKVRPLLTELLKESLTLWPHLVWRPDFRDDCSCRVMHLENFKMVVSEMLTNAAKAIDPKKADRRIDVKLTEEIATLHSAGCERAVFRVTVSNPRPAGGARPGEQSGVRWMQKMAEMHGGTFEDTESRDVPNKDHRSVWWARLTLPQFD